MKVVDVIVVGAGAAGLMCAIEAGNRGRKVLVLEKSNKAGKKILMSGGGRCNFTNLEISPEKFISQNPHFCKSALSRYTQWDFIALVERYKIAYYEKTLGQLFCEDKSSRILDMLLQECHNHGAHIQLNQSIIKVDKQGQHFKVQTQDAVYQCDSLVLATGGLSIPSLGGGPFGYQVAKQFGIQVHPLRAGLVPFTLHKEDKERFETLAGISILASVACNKQTFRENILFTHRGLSGPAALQISSYWQAGDALHLHFLPELACYEALLEAKAMAANSSLRTVLSNYVAKKALDVFYPAETLAKPLKQFSPKALQAIADVLQNFYLKPNATEGYRTAEVTLGGVDCNALSSQSFESKTVPGLFFIGEVVDVSGWLGGYNFQWAWSSGWAAGQVV